jgi:predicted MPP superfamily phosphohydrolase
MKSKSVFATIIIVSCLIGFLTIDTYAGEIIVPWRAKKEIVKQGSSFPIWFRKGKTETITSVTLIGPFNKVPLAIKQNNTGSWYFDDYTHATYNCSLTVEVPMGTPEDLYDLIVKTSTGTYTSRSAVKVVKEFLSHYYICHFSDPHVSVSWSDSGNVTAPIMQALGEILSIIDPELAICTGDNIIGFSKTTIVPKSYSERWDAFWDGTTPKGLGGMNNARVPVFTTTGNNDYDKFRTNSDSAKMYKLTDWDSLCGMRIFGFSYNETRFLAFDDYLGEIQDHAPYIGLSKDFPNLQITALEKYLATAGEGKLRIVLEHAPNRVNTMFCDNHKVQLALCGHIHRDGMTTIGATPTNVFTTAYVCYAEYWSPGNKPIPNSAMTKLRIIEVDNNKVVSNQSINIMDYIHVMNGLDDGKFLTLTFNKPNKGNDTLITATIKNDIDYNFTSCKIRFVMPKGKYTTDKGTLIQSFNNDIISVYDVKIPVEAGSSVSVTIRPYRTTGLAFQNSDIITPERLTILDQ